MPRHFDHTVQAGTLRAAINTGNKALVQQKDNALHGVSPELAKRLAAELGLELETVLYDGAGKVFTDADKGNWDVAFLAIDEKRAEKVTFTRPYVTIEATFAVRNDSAIQEIEEIDRAGIEVLTSVGSAYDMHLSRTLAHATLDRFGTPDESFEVFRSGRCDAVAGVRASLHRAFADDPSIRVLSGVLTKVEQAMVLPGQDNPDIRTLDEFVARAISQGFVDAALSI